MKHRVLTSIAHNIADSLGGGMGFMIGVYQMDVFGEAAAGPEGFIEIDLLTGVMSGVMPSASLARAVRLYRDALPDLCRRHGGDVADFARLAVRYSGAPTRTLIVEVTDRSGKTSRDVYAGPDAARPRSLDPLGRIRRTRSSPTFAPGQD
jgi:hypothetical protein